MRILESGRFVLPPGVAAPRRYAERNLLSIHGRAARLRAIARGARLYATDREAAETDEALHAALQLPAVKGADWLLVRDYGGSPRGRNVLFFFRDDDDTPQAIVKVRRIRGKGSSLVHEAGVLRALRPLLPETLRETVPQVDDLVVTERHELLVLSALPGQPLSVSMQRSLRPRSSHAPHLLEAGRWLGAVHGATAVAHGDFWPRNILFRGSALTGVVDWEHGEVPGEPWDDLFTLPLLFATAAPTWRRHERLESFRRAFVEDTAVSRVVRAYFDAYASLSGADRSCFAPEFREYIVRQAGKEEPGWRSQYPWPAMRVAMQHARRSVFSG